MSCEHVAERLAEMRRRDDEPWTALVTTLILCLPVLYWGGWLLWFLISTLPFHMLILASALVLVVRSCSRETRWL